MKRASTTLSIGAVIGLWVAVLLASSAAWAKPTTPDQARNVVLNWVGKEARPLGTPVGGPIKEVQTFPDAAGNPAYYVVSLNPAGLVLVPADDLVEPIIGFLPEGQYDPSPTNPLGALVSRDIPGRVLQARQVEARGLETLAPGALQTVAQRKWAWLSGAATGPEASEFAWPGPLSDERVPPLVASKWDQGAVNGNACYNYYTPPGPDGSGSNYLCGCVATAMAQLMRFWKYPTAPAAGTFNITIAGSPTTRTIRGGSDPGGAYDWDNMILEPLSGVNLTNQQAIGALTHDAGVSVNMDYNTVENHGPGSATNAAYASYALCNTFGYSNAISASAWTGAQVSNLPAVNRNNMINPNLDAGYPTLLGLRGSVGSYAIVCDGYGYNAATLYHHLNMGWSGQDDAWYALPIVDTSWTTFNVLTKVIYNIYKTGSGEIISGRVTNAAGAGLNGATVTAAGPGGPLTATTNDKGIYAFAKLPSGTTYTISASLGGYTFAPRSLTTGTSVTATYPPSPPGDHPVVSPSSTTGNFWGVNFVDGAPVLTLNHALDNAALGFTNSGDNNWYPQTDTWTFGGSAARSGPIGNSQSTSLQATVMGPGKLSFDWKVSSEKGYDILSFLVDGVANEDISGEVDWTLKPVTIPAGPHTVTWRYRKDGAWSYGSDCGWVDKVVYKGPDGAAILLLLLD